MDRSQYTTVSVSSPLSLDYLVEWWPLQNIRARFLASRGPQRARRFGVGRLEAMTAMLSSTSDDATFAVDSPILSVFSSQQTPGAIRDQTLPDQ